MPEAVIRVVDVYPYRLHEGEAAEFLLLHRAQPVEYAGQWRMVGGKIEEGEAAWEAARREVREETGAAPRRLWSIPSMNAFYEWREDRVNLIPPFAAEIGGDLQLDREHDALCWLAAEEAAARLSWPEQKRLLRLAGQMLEDGVPPQLFIDLEREE